jgi:hypothetical protein
MGSIDYITKYLTNLLNTQIFTINTDLNLVNNALFSLQNSSVLSINNISNKVDNQNQKIDDSINEKYNESTKVQDINLQYNKLELDRIKSQNFTLLIIYYILILILSFILFFKERLLNLYRNIGIIIILFFYPFLINIIEYLLYSIFSVTYSFFSSNKYTGNVYINSY